MIKLGRPGTFNCYCWYKLAKSFWEIRVISDERQKTVTPLDINITSRNVS